MLARIRKYLQKDTEAAPLAVFRILFGLLMFISLVRFYSMGWIEELYIEPVFFFSYYGFGWVRPIGEYTYLIFLVCAVSSLFVAIGFRYRMSILVFFLSFTWIELMDKTTYLNHYYFISVLSFLMIFLPAHAFFSVDAARNSKVAAARIPSWCADSVKFLLCIVYFYAGLAKLNPDWLFSALPMKIWLPANQHIPVLGNLFTMGWTPYLFSWAGAAFDLSIPFFLWMKSTRLPAYGVVVIFHLTTWLLFPIGMFPFIMIFSTLIFFDSGLHQKILNVISRLPGIKSNPFQTNAVYSFSNRLTRRLSVAVIILLFLIQVLVPFRYLLYPGNVFWTEEGYRFSWRVMLMEKFGTARFTVVDSENGLKIPVTNSDFLTPMQQKQMATRPDFILEYAHFLRDFYSEKGVQNPKVYTESYVTLNGRRSRLFIDPDVNLADVECSFGKKSWVLPFSQK